VEQILEFINKDCPRKIQKMLFSATIPRWVLELSNTFMSRSRKTVDLIKNFEIKTSTTIEHLCLCMSKERRALN
jgi:ATP-dependent RNA helicase DDX21